MAPFDNGIIGFLSQVEMVKEADLGLKYMKSQGYDKEIQRLYKEYREMEFHLQQGYRGGQKRAPGGAAANRMRERQAEIGRKLRKNLKKGDAKRIFTGTKEIPGLSQKGFIEGAWEKPSKGQMSSLHQKTMTGPGGQPLFSAREKAEIGTQQMAPERRQHLRETARAGRREKMLTQQRPVEAKDRIIQDYMQKNKGKAPSSRYVEKAMRREAATSIRGNVGGTQDWTWDAGKSDRAAARPAGNQPYYGGRGGGGPQIHTSPLGAQPGDPARAPTGGGSRIPGPRPGEAAPGTAGVGPRGANQAMAAPQGAAKKPGFLSRLGRRAGRVGRVGAVAGGLALLGGGLLAYNANKNRRGGQMQPQYGPMPMPLASAQYGGGYY